MLENYAASDNEIVDIVKVAQVAEDLINKIPSKINYPFLILYFLAQVNKDKSGAINFEKTLIHR